MKEENIELPTQVETGITDNLFLDYFFLPFLMAILISVIFKKQIVSLVKKIEKIKES